MKAKASLYLRISGFILSSITLISAAFTYASFPGYINPRITTAAASLFFISSLLTYHGAAFLSEGDERKAGIMMIISPLFHIAAALIYELGLFRIRSYSSLFSALLEMMMCTAPISIYYASLDRLHLKKNRNHSAIWICTAMLSIILLFAGAFHYAEFSYIYMPLSTYRAYSVLSVSFALLIAAISVIILQGREGNGISLIAYLLIIIAMAIEFAMNLMEYDEGRLCKAIASGGISEQYSSADLIKAWLFIFFSSFAASAMLSQMFLLSELSGNEKKERAQRSVISICNISSEEIEKEEKKHRDSLSSIYEIPPNVPKRRSELHSS